MSQIPDEVKRKLFTENLNLLNNAEIIKKQLNDVARWSGEANFIALFSNDVDIKNAAIRASTKVIHDLAEKTSNLVDGIRDALLDISSAVVEKGEEDESKYE